MVAAVEHLPEEPLQVDRLRGVEAHAARLRSDAALDVRQQARPPAGGLQDRPEEVRGRRLAVCPGDRGDGQVGRRVVEELDRRAWHRHAGALDDELGNIQVEPPFDHERHRSARDRLRCEIVAVGPGAGDAKEQGVARHLPRVVRQLADLEGDVPNDVGRSERCRKPLQLHRRSSLVSAPHDARHQASPLQEHARA